MAATQGHEARVGLLVVLGIAAVIALILISDKIDLEKTYKITVYLNNGEGLRRASPVTFAGLPVGQVISVEQVQHPKGQVKAVAEIKQSRLLPANSVVRLSSSGFFGDSFLAMTPGDSAVPGTIKVDGSAELIGGIGALAEASGKAAGVLDSVNSLLDAPTRAQTQRLIGASATMAEQGALLLSELRVTNQAVNAQLSGLSINLNAMVQRLDQTAANTDRLISRLENLTARIDQRVDPLLDGATAALAAVSKVAAEGAETATALRHFMAANREPMTAALNAVAAATGRIETLVAAIVNGEGLLGQLVVSRPLAQDLHNAAVDASALLKTLADQPSRVIFDADAPTSERDKNERSRRKQQRALAEWLGFTRPATTAVSATRATSPASGR